LVMQLGQRGGKKMIVGHRTKSPSGCVQRLGLRQSSVSERLHAHAIGAVDHVSDERGGRSSRGGGPAAANPAGGGGGWEGCGARSTREPVYLARQIGTQQGPSPPVK